MFFEHFRWAAGLETKNYTNLLHTEQAQKANIFKFCLLIIFPHFYDILNYSLDTNQQTKILQTKEFGLFFGIKTDPLTAKLSTKRYIQYIQN